MLRPSSRDCVQHCRLHSDLITDSKGPQTRKEDLEPGQEVDTGRTTGEADEESGTTSEREPFIVT